VSASLPPPCSAFPSHSAATGRDASRPHRPRAVVPLNIRLTPRLFSFTLTGAEEVEQYAAEAQEFAIKAEEHATKAKVRVSAAFLHHTARAAAALARLRAAHRYSALRGSVVVRRGAGVGAGGHLPTGVRVPSSATPRFAPRFARAPP